MNNLSFFVVKESQVAFFCFFKKTKRYSLFGLQPCIALEFYSKKFINHLREAGAIQTKRRASAPEIGSIQIPFCNFLYGMRFLFLKWKNNLSVKRIFLLAE